MASDLVCTYNHYGHCKFGSKCRKFHAKDICSIPMCQSKECMMRHPKPCKFFAFYGRCKFAEYCSFTHNKTSDVEKELETLKQEINEIKKQNTELKEMILNIDG